MSKSATTAEKNLIPIQDFAKKYKIKQRTAYNMYEKGELKGKREKREITSTRTMKTILIDEDHFLASRKGK